MIGEGYAAIVLDRLAKQTCQVVDTDSSSIFARDQRFPGMAIAVAACGTREEIVGSRVSLRKELEDGAIAMPAYWDGEVRGALVAEAPAGSRFGRDEVELLRELANTAGAALGHAEHREHTLLTIRTRVRELTRTIDTHDGYTAGHSEEVVAWCRAVGERLRLSLPDIQELELGALLHDVGKIRVPLAILRKPGGLTPGERKIVNCHPIWSAELLESVPGLEPVATVVRFHHERWDGTGYPDGLFRDRIPVASRIIAVCDAYQAMTSHRAYRSALPPGAAASELCAHAGTQFDPAVVDCFVEVLQERGWPLGPWGEREVAMNGGAA